MVRQAASVSGRDLKGAYPSRDENGRPAVSFNLNADGAQRMSRATEENIGKMLAIVLDKRIQSAPRINGRITDSALRALERRLRERFGFQGTPIRLIVRAQKRQQGA